MFLKFEGFCCLKGALFYFFQYFVCQLTCALDSFSFDLFYGLAFIEYILCLTELVNKLFNISFTFHSTYVLVT